MPWSAKQMQVAQAVAHGWHPSGSASGFTEKFAHQVIREGVKGKTLGEIGRKRKKRMK